MSPPPRNKLSLPLEEAKRILFWRYYRNDNSSEKALWNTGLFRYIENIPAACILKDVAVLKVNTTQQVLAEELFAQFCAINALDKEDLPAADGALTYGKLNFLFICYFEKPML